MQSKKEGFVLSPTKFLTFTDGYACYRPVKRTTFNEAVEMACAAITYARDNRIDRLLVDATQLTGFPPPSTFDRFELACKIAEIRPLTVKIAVVALPEYIDPQKFGVTVASNRGVRTDVFTTRDTALAWLMDDHAR
jgi:hypothetical protein